MIKINTNSGAIAFNAPTNYAPKIEMVCATLMDKPPMIVGLANEPTKIPSISPITIKGTNPTR